jgi:hypothetical protein
MENNIITHNINYNDIKDGVFGSLLFDDKNDDIDTEFVTLDDDLKFIKFKMNNSNFTEQENNALNRLQTITKTNKNVYLKFICGILTKIKNNEQFTELENFLFDRMEKIVNMNSCYVQYNNDEKMILFEKILIACEHEIIQTKKLPKELINNDWETNIQPFNEIFKHIPIENELDGKIKYYPNGILCDKCNRISNYYINHNILYDPKQINYQIKNDDNLICINCLGLEIRNGEHMCEKKMMNI